MKKVKLNRVGNSWGRNWILNNGINPDFLVGLGLSLLDFEDCFVGRSFPQEIEIIEKDVSLPLEEEESRSRCLIRLDNGKYTFILKKFFHFLNIIISNHNLPSSLNVFKIIDGLKNCDLPSNLG